MDKRQRPHNMMLGAAIPVVGVTVRRTRDGVGLHGRGWWWRVASVWRLHSGLGSGWMLVMAVLVGVSPPGVMVCCAFVLHRWVGGGLHRHQVKALPGSGRGQQCRHLGCQLPS
jgi:hypothetical protein